ncbi:hypothetical protein [Pseudoalteromonas sp. TB64]|uniref:hypothetical protein n=1 Tax=Pseudoalteromonas sp. TB64 TaxID=1938600 RepID=UPI0004276E1E|nr:hypothetical protein [Pseudoalteromonas sp. TB64]
MTTKDLSISYSIPKLKYSLACAVAIVSSVISYSSLAFTILIMLWPYSAAEELGFRVIVFFIGICICIVFGAFVALGKRWVIKIYNLLALSAIGASLVYITHLTFWSLSERSSNGFTLSILFIVLNFMLLLLFRSKYLKVSVNVIKRLKKRGMNNKTII